MREFGFILFLKEEISKKGCDKMIPLSQIDEIFSVFKENKLIITGNGTKSISLLRLFTFFQIEIFAFYHPQKVADTLEGIPVFTTEELLNQPDYENYSYQIGDTSPEIDSFYHAIPNVTLISYEETLNILSAAKRLQLIEENPYFYYEEDLSLDNEIKKSMRFEEARRQIISSDDNSVLLVCLPAKTGDYTLVNTFQKHSILYTNLWLNSQLFQDYPLTKMASKVKIITAVREPIGQMISAFYECLSLSHHYYNDTFFKAIFQDKETLLKSGGDVQLFFDRWLAHIDYPWGQKRESSVKLPMYLRTYYPVVSFVPLFQKHLFSYFDSPFDREKGYTIVKEGNVEIFVYQLEKMDQIAPEMSDFIGQRPFDVFVKGNVAQDKWVANSYHQAQKELKIPQSLVNQCFQEEFVKHCYSLEDMEKFKEKWRTCYDTN